MRYIIPKSSIVLFPDHTSQFGFLTTPLNLVSWPHLSIWFPDHTSQFEGGFCELFDQVVLKRVSLAMLATVTGGGIRKAYSLARSWYAWEVGHYMLYPRLLVSWSKSRSLVCQLACYKHTIISLYYILGFVAFFAPPSKQWLFVR